MADINICTLSGRLTADCIAKTTPNGKSITEFSIANNTGFGQYEKVIFVKVTVWGKQGEAIRQYLTKGKQVAISGEIGLNKWTRQDGTSMQEIQMTANQVILLGGGNQQTDFNSEQPKNNLDPFEQPVF